MKVFAQVGTTKFDMLVDKILSHEFIEFLGMLNCQKLTIQCGNYHRDDLEVLAPFETEIYRFKPSLEQDQRDADIIITHGGAGSVFESLMKEKITLAVINQELMGNHQLEIVEELKNEGYLEMCLDLERLGDKFRLAMKTKFKRLPRAELDKFDDLLCEELSQSAWIGSFKGYIEVFFLIMMLLFSYIHELLYMRPFVVILIMYKIWKRFGG